MSGRLACGIVPVKRQRCGDEREAHVRSDGALICDFSNMAVFREFLRAEPKATPVDLESHTVQSGGSPRRGLT